jgi:hypothetical protein
VLVPARHDNMLTLKRASKSRPSGEWSDDDYDVFDGKQHIGRIMWTHAARLSPGFYRGLGRDPAVVIEEGKAAMRARFEAR